MLVDNFLMPDWLGTIEFNICHYAPTFVPVSVFKGPCPANSLSVLPSPWYKSSLNIRRDCGQMLNV